MSSSEVLYMGIDWGEYQHSVCLQDAAGETLWKKDVEHSPPSVARFVEQVTAEFPDRSIDVAIETSGGPLVETLLEAGWSVLHINPKQLDRFRDRFCAAGAKDDRRDSEVLASSVRTDRRAFHLVCPDDPAIVELREWSRIHEELTADQRRLANQLRAQLSRYYPQALALGFELSRPVFLDLFEAGPTPARAQRLTPKRIDKILRSHRIRRLKATEVHEILHSSSWKVSNATIEAAQAHAQLVASRLKLVGQQRRQALQTLERCLRACRVSENTESSDEPAGDKEPHDATILHSLPGVGTIVLAVLLTEATQVLKARDYYTWRKLSGVAPVTFQTGRRPKGSQKNGRVCVLMRRACNKRLRQAVYHWARVAVQRDDKTKQRYHKLRKRGLGYNTALRVVADGLLRTACAMLRNRTLYKSDHLRNESIAA